MTKNNSPLDIPALFAQLGDWKYYNTVMRLADVDNYISYAENINEVRPGKQLSDMIQRALDGKRAKDISQYLLTNDDRFFNALVVAVYGGDPKWRDFDIQPSSRNTSQTIPEWVENAFGLLQLSGRERLFPLDGQHRLAGIKKALAVDPELGNEKISVIFVSHHVTDEGRRRTRKLFTTLNRTSVNVSKSDLIALDESDTAAIITRRLVEENKYFKNDDVVLAKYGAANLTTNDVEHFITIIKLYDFVGYLLRYVLYNFDRTMRIKLRYVRPADATLEEYYQSICVFFEKLILKTPTLKSYFGASSAAQQAKILKSERQVKLNILYRSVGVEVFLRTINQVVASGKTIDEAIDEMARLPTSFTAKLYDGLLYDVGRERIIPGRVRLTSKIAAYVLGYGQTDVTKLREQYAAALGKDISAVKLPTKLK